MTRSFKINDQSVFTSLICFLWIYNSILRYFQSALLHFPVIGELLYTIFPILLFGITIALCLSIIIKALRFQDLVFGCIILSISLITLLVARQETKQFDVYAFSFLMIVFPMYYIGVASAEVIRNQPSVVELLTKLSLISVVINLLFYIVRGISFDAEWESLQYLPYMLLPHLLILTRSVFEMFKPFRFAVLFAGFVFIMFLGNRGSIVCYLLYLLLLIIHKVFTAKKWKVIAPLCIVVIALYLLIFTNFYDDFTLFLYNKALEYGLSTRVILLLRKDFGIVSFDSNRLFLQSKLFKSILERPFFGHGLTGDFSIIGGYSHNIFIELLVEFGIVGGGVLIVLFIINFLLAIKKSTSWENKSFLLMMCCFAFVKLLISETYLDQPSFFFFLGLIVGTKRLKTLGEDKTYEAKHHVDHLQLYRQYR